MDLHSLLFIVAKYGSIRRFSCVNAGRLLDVFYIMDHRLPRLVVYLASLGLTYRIWHNWHNCIISSHQKRGRRENPTLSSSIGSEWIFQCGSLRAVQFWTRAIGVVNTVLQWRVLCLGVFILLAL
ncbi:hypothetical protein BRADI_5g22532v3 [Brachypodium distachyon]|uniref:Uncharacterized protein n=1 Tax=Brachypodium distachyon TaxID=15368 RepID=A0A0Q3EA95_BRADI|nr:hypothetical protein BRADI_5g22532v3 [Brachypodium distachyon]